ncbi:mucin-binding protein [Lacticaseibacillus nasuensis]|uniref:mucin-binding protein n=1 Tax=Lacticaseibacillus nasuensis TaxID=944671 RepID=UPI002247CB5D|nr:hypothetical protein [Lacticaseibacillus nasuensis]MCX2455220.1 hypothetical protein [Lacticaseibacillus nasuensis]
MRGKHSEPVRRVKLYKKRKLWVALGIFGAFAISLQTGAIAPANAAGAAPTITTSETATDQATIVVQFRAPSGILTDYTQTKTVPAGYTGTFPIDYNAVIAQLRTKGYTFANGAPAAPSSYEAGKTYTYIVGVSDLTAKVTHTEPKQAGDIAVPAFNTPFPESVGDKLSQSAMNQTVTQTIHYRYSDGTTAAPDATQSITVYRDVKSVDLATGAVTYNPWVTVAPAATTSPTDIVGYEPDQKTVTLAKQNDPTEVTVKYSPSVRLQQINLVDDDDNGKTILGGYTKRGVSNVPANYDLTSSIPDGYVLADGQSASGTIHFTTTDPAPIEIHLKHGTRVIPATGPYTDEATQADLNRAFTQTVHFVYANGAKAADDKVQTAPSTRSATVDAVTGKRLSYSDWRNGDFAAVKAPEIAGYTPDVAEVPEAKNVDANAEAKVTYTPDAKSTTVQFIDDDAAKQPVGNPINVAGVTDGTSPYDVTSQIPAGYVLAADNSATGSVHFTATGAGPIEIHLKHGTTVIGSADQDATAVKPLKLTQNYTQTIHYQYADNYKPTADVTQTATSTRTATVDNVTGQVVSYSDWINGNYAAVATPAVAGYTADVPEVAAATNVTADAEHTVTYTPDSKSTTVQFIDDDAAEQPVGDPIAVTGVTNGTKSYDVTSQIPAGYVLAAGNSATGSVQFTATGADPIEIHLDHGTTVIGSADQDATAVKPSDLTKNYTQTVHYVFADGRKAKDDTTQTATSTRTATIDNVTNAVLGYSDWTNGDFAAVPVPAIKGYTANVDEIPAQSDVTADAEYTVTYTADPVKDRGTLPVTGGQSGQGTGSQTGGQTSAGASTGAAAETGRNQANAGNAGTTTANPTNQTAAAAHGTLPSTGEVEARAALSLGIVTLMSTLALAGASRKRAR